MAATFATDPRFVELADAVVGAETFEALVRPLLALLQDVTGLESTYLTAVDEGRGVQNVLFADNRRALNIPEGLAVPWEDTLCRRALTEDCAYTDDVEGRWGDSDAARELGLKTYLSTPVRLSDGSLYGTLCAASAESRPMADGADRVLAMFSKLVAHQIERESLLRELARANRVLSDRANTDALTSLPNRRALLEELTTRLGAAQRGADAILVAFIDLDGFKQINDTYGHEAGDRFLTCIGDAVRKALRADDFAARLGGDEFVVLGKAPADLAEAATISLRTRLGEATKLRVDLGTVQLDYPGASIGVVHSEHDDRDAEALLRRADAAMYAIKLARRATRT